MTGILKPSTEEKVKTIEIKKVASKKPTSSDTGFDDPSRKHVCNVCSKKFQKRSNLIDHLRLHANVKVFSCEVSKTINKSSFPLRLTHSYLQSIARNPSFKPGITKHTLERIPKKNRKLVESEK